MNDPAVHTPGASSFAMALMFGSIVFAMASLAARTYLTGDVRALETAYYKSHAERFNPRNFSSWMTLLYHSSILGLILLFAYICEFHPPFPHGEKSYDRDQFLFLTVLLFIASSYTITRNDRSASKSTTASSSTKSSGATNKGAPSNIPPAQNTSMFPSSKQGVINSSPAKQRRSTSTSGGPGDYAAESSSNTGGGMIVSDDITMDMSGAENDSMMMEDIEIDNKGSNNKNKPSKTHPQSSSSSQQHDDEVFNLLQGGGGGMKKRTGSTGNLDDILKDAVSVPAASPMSNGSSHSGGHFMPSQQQQQSMMAPSSSYSNAVTTKKNNVMVQYPLPIEPVKACNDVLNRDQTEEWKGWMQFMFLLYHYYHAEETYNAIRIMITCYVWMTGFGNFSFFYLKNDFSLVRVLQMLWRLNFLVIFLCLSQGTTYILYYICPLHTYFFLMVYATMRIGSHLNYSRNGLRMKLMIVACIIYLIWDVDSGLFQLLHFPFLGTKPQLGGSNGAMWEWYFRSTLDHWSTYLGMIFALNFPIVSLFYRKLESQHPIKHWGGKILMGSGLLAAFYVWLTGPYQQEKRDYNATNSYFGFIPLITYIYFRNLTPTLRSYSLDLLHQIGKTTLETYLMQHHIWLTSDAKSLLILLPGYPMINMLLVTCLYYLVSRRLYKLTLFLRGMLLPNDKAQCIQSLVSLAMLIGMYYMLALSLMTLGMVSISTFLIVCVVGGALLYQTVMDSSWQQYRESSPIPKDMDPMLIKSGGGANAQQQQQQKQAQLYQHDSPIARISPPLIGLMSLFILTLGYQAASTNGAGKLLPLPATCEADVNHGTWIPIDGCNSYVEGVGYRESNVMGMAPCGEGSSYTWGWYGTPSSSMCRFTHRSKKVLQKQLQERHVVFIGDSMTRSIFHAFSRAMGDKEAGSFDATVPKHSDIVRTIGSTKLEFKWAPMAQDAHEKLRGFTKAALATPEGRSMAPDVILLGGGAWDRLHVWATNDQDHKQLKSNLRLLALEMVKAKEECNIPTVWMNPTTINTKALMHQDKRENLKEEDMVQMRELTADMGVWAASTFVLDGTSFTHERSEESFDGVHYPHQIYDAGAQILSNAMDWILPERYVSTKFSSPSPGSMSNPMLGLFMLCFVAVGLFYYDGFLGFSYLASVFGSHVMPNEMYEEAFEPLHRQAKLPPIVLTKRRSNRSLTTSGIGGTSSGSSSTAANDYSSSNNPTSGVGGGTSGNGNTNAKSSYSNTSDEILSLLGGNSTSLGGHPTHNHPSGSASGDVELGALLRSK